MSVGSHVRMHCIKQVGQRTDTWEFNQLHKRENKLGNNCDTHAATLKQGHTNKTDGTIRHAYNRQLVHTEPCQCFQQLTFCNDSICIHRILHTLESTTNPLWHRWVQRQNTTYGTIGVGNHDYNSAPSAQRPLKQVGAKTNLLSEGYEHTHAHVTVVT